MIELSGSSQRQEAGGSPLPLRMIEVTLQPVNALSFPVTALLCLLAPALFAASGPADPKEELLQPGYQLVFVGDSITHGFSEKAVKKGDTYHGLFQVYLSTHFPGRHLWTVNAGRAGDNLGGLLSERMDDQDVYRTLPGVLKKSDVAFIMYGMNDGGSLGYLNPNKLPGEESRQKRRGDYEKRLGAAVDDLKGKGVKVVIVSTTFYDETVDKKVTPAIGFNVELAKYVEIGRKVAQEKDVMFIDVLSLMTEKNLEHQKDNPKFSYTRDRVHPHSDGSAIALYAMLKAFGLEGDVFQVTIDAAKTPPAMVEAKDAEITDLQRAGGAITWTASEEKLPLPVNTKEYFYDFSFDHVPFTEEFNRQFLQVTGLAEGNYTLEIGEANVASFSAAELAEGVDLSRNEKTPQYQEAWKLRELLYRKQELEITRRDINSLRLNITGHFKGDPAVSADLAAQNWDEPDVEKLLGYMERAITEKKSAGKGTGGFFGHVAGQTKRNLAKVVDYNKELVEIRTQIENLPESRAWKYRLAPAK